MAGTCKNKRGFLLISSIIVLTLMIVVVNFYLDAIIQETKIESVVMLSPQAYFLAEAGVQEAFWKLQNDADWKKNFATKKTWSASFNREDDLVPNGSVVVMVTNRARADAVIVATSTVVAGESVVQRVIETTVFKALNEIAGSGIALFSDDSIKSVGGKLTIDNGGTVFTNKDLDLSFFSNWTIDGEAQAVNKITVSPSSRLSASGGIHDKDRPPRPNEILMPEIDFDSADEGSLKSQANQVYSESEFAKLLQDSPTLTLDGITYITGNAGIKADEQVTVNGALAADGSFSIGSGFSKKTGPAVLTINHTIAQSGLFAKKNIMFGSGGAQITIAGLVYAGSNFRLQDGLKKDVTVNITGGIVAKGFDLFIAWNPIIINFNQEYIEDGLGAPLSSPVLLINHWEEEY